VAVEAAHDRGTIGNSRVELLARWRAVRKRTVAPPASANPRQIAMRVGVRADARPDLLQRLRTLQVDGLHLETAAQHVRVHVLEAGHDRAAVRVDDLRLRSSQPSDLVVRADGRDPGAADGNGLPQAATIRRVD